jgi:hypothetical protein
MTRTTSTSLHRRCCSRGLRLLALVAFVAALVPEHAAGKFLDRTSSSGLTWIQMTWSAAFADLDGDGDLDLYSGHHFFAPILYWNDGTGVFDSGLHPQPWTGAADRHGVLAISLDGDEDIDFYISHGSAGGGAPEASELYRNDGAGSFTLITGGSMADEPGRGRAACAADFDGDQQVDVWVGKAPNPASPNSLYRNEGSLAFTDVAALVGLAELEGTVGGLWGDTDDDGDPDLFVGGEEFLRPSVLYRNDGGVFTDIAASFSPALPVVSGADFGDFDNDGDLDLAVCDGNIGLFDTYDEGDTLTFYFNSRFGDSGVDGLTVPSNADTAEAIFRWQAYFDTSAIFLGPAEVNPPSLPQITLTDDYVGEPSFNPGVDEGIWVWRQSPGGAWEIRCSTPNIGGTNFDGWLTEGVPIAGCTPYELEDPGFGAGGPRVWRNDGGSFVEITSSLGLPLMLNPRDISWVDYDNDGDLDLHVVDMGTSATWNAPDLLLRNDGAVFTDVTFEQKITGGDQGLGDGGVWGDIDGDGDLDLYLQEGAGPLTYSAYGRATMLVNDICDTKSLVLHLVGGASGKPAVGTKVTAVVDGRTIHRRVLANAWRGFQDPLSVHVGLGAESSADSVVIEWPAGTIDFYTDLPAGSWQLEEGVNVTAAPRPPAAAAGAGADWRLCGVAPQPSGEDQTIRFETRADVHLAVSVYDVAGHRVRLLHNGPIRAGETSLRWDGRDDDGRSVAAGIYLVRATDGTRERAAKLVRLR